MSGSGGFHQSTSPFCSAAAAVAASGIICHSTRSNVMRLPPASQSAFLLARDVAVELLEHRLSAGHPFVLA